MSSTRKNQGLAQQLVSGNHYGVFIDDTGSPGMANTPAKLHPERKTWVAVVIPPTKIRSVMSDMTEDLDALRSDLGLPEFHFVEIYSGKGPFREIAPSARLVIFQLFADLFYIHELPIYIQTLDPETHKELMADWRARARVISGFDPDTGKVLTTHFGRFPKIASCFDLERYADAALWLLLTRVWDHVLSRQKAQPGRAMVFLDEGFKRAGFSVEIDVLDSALLDGRLYFTSSSAMPLLQLADFAAFCLNRTQLIIRKEKRTEFEIELLRMLSPLAALYMNATPRVVWPTTDGEML